ncbi:MAG: hypothetical protein R3C53_14025 [Pirellulaceae bacterium]
MLSRPPHLGAHPLSQPQGSHELISQPQVGAAHPPPHELISHPQVGAAPQASPQPQPVSQPALQPRLPIRLSIARFLHSILPNNSISGLRRGLLQPESQPQGSQEAISQPQLGAAPQPPPRPHPPPQEAISHPQVGAAQPPPHGAAISQPQLGAAQPPPRRPRRRPPNLHPPLAPQGSQELISTPQDGSQPPPQLDNSHPQLGSAEHPVSQQALSQPAPFRPSMRSKSPPPKLGVQRLAPSIRDPTSMFNFIEPQLPKR